MEILQEIPPEPCLLAPYAAHPAQSRGRRAPEPEDPSRSVYQRDRDRILHSTAFRRLEYKTQVFVNHEGDHYRTRLTHSLEVAQVARSMARVLRANEDLAEALALAHDLGHTPFGHAGEDALQAVMEPYGGFDHNAHTIRILTQLEHRYASFDGLNLAWETLEGIAKHNGPVTEPIPRSLHEYTTVHDLELGTYAGLEAQLSALADDIAYNNHDMDDGLRSGLFTLAQSAELPLVARALADVRARYGDVDETRLVHEAIRRMIHAMVQDVIRETTQALAQLPAQTPAAIRAFGAPVARFSPAMENDLRSLRDFLQTRMYRHPRVNRMSSKAARIVTHLFTFFLAEPECLPLEWQTRARTPHTPETAHTVADFIAGMTDRFAIDEHERIFNMRERV